MNEQRQKFYGKYRGTVINNIDPLQMGRLQVHGARRVDRDAVELGDALLADRRQADGDASPCRRSARASGSSSSRATPTIRSGPAASGASLPRCRRSRWPASRPVPGIVLQTTLQNTLVISDLPGPTGGIMLKSTTGATIIVNDTGIYIQNGKGAMIMMVGPTVTINNGALAII